MQLQKTNKPVPSQVQVKPLFKEAWKTMNIVEVMQTN
jgi:hypothetical protein